MSRNPSEKFILLFESCKRSYLIAESLISRLTSQLDSIITSQKRTDLQTESIAVITSVVSFVDFAHRFGSLMDSLPLVPKRGRILKALRLALNDVEKCRNFLQHMRGDLSDNKSINYPILGSISWARANRCYTLHCSQPSQSETTSMSYDMQEGRWTATHVYALKDCTIDLDETLAQMKTAYDGIASAIISDDQNLPKLEWGGTFITTITMNSHT